MEFKQARHYTPTGGKRVIDLVVIHDMESEEEPDTAENVASWFAGANAPQASAHYCGDSNSVIQCVHDMDVAWHAPGANHNGIGIEHAGRARQTAAQWADDYSENMLQVTGSLTAKLLVKHKLPNEFVDAAGLLHGKRGITTHWEVSKAFKRSDHTDPGQNFPIHHFLEIVSINLNLAGDHMPEEQEIVVNSRPIRILTNPNWPVGAYMVVCEDGGTFPFGGGPQIGSLGNVKLNKPIEDVEVTPSGNGLIMTADDGGIFALGDAAFKGRVVYKG
jgi:N-acetyl-anhydromuramyl-L-alanine amidase AmpD